jgi:hypothetical protein
MITLLERKVSKILVLGIMHKMPSKCSQIYCSNSIFLEPDQFPIREGRNLFWGQIAYFSRIKDWI